MQIKVVIPVYKDKLSKEESRSLKQCLSVLRKHSIVIVTHALLNMEKYLSIFEEENVAFDVELFDNQYFKSVTAYSRLLLSREFYLRFQNTEYILIYQLDAFVFRDEIIRWYDKDYDYIGAPWFKHYKTYEKGNKLYKVGNGGVSLRKVSSFLNLFDKILPLSIFPFYVKNIRKKGFFSMCFKTLKMFFLLIFTNRVVEYYLMNLTDERINEDCFWTDGLSNTRLALSVPDTIVAAEFCIEKSPSYLYHLIGDRLPFACHAYEKNEYESFWKNHIENIK